MMKKITILGSGFGALTTIIQLRKQNVTAEITVISPRDHLHYVPSSIWIPAGLRYGDELKIPLVNFFARHNVNYVQASVTGMEEDGRCVLTDKGSFFNDYLVIATGGRLLKKLPGIEHALIPCQGIEVGQEIKLRLDIMTGGTIAFGFSANPNENGAVRGGPIFEFLFIIDTLLRKQGRREKFELVFFNPSNQPGARLGANAVKGLLGEMARRDIKTHLGKKLVRFEPGQVEMDGICFPADMIIFMPGLTGPKWIEGTGLPLSSGGMIRADQQCQVDGFSHVWVVGDAGSYDGPDWLPKQAHQADLQAKAVGKNISILLQGQTPSENFKPELICIVDALDSATLIYRSVSMNIISPRSILFHWMKRAFERYYLKRFS